MRRRSALPESAGAVTAASQRCSLCNAASGPPEFLCPTCPRRMTQHVRLQDQGFRRLAAHDREMTRVQVRNAKAAQQLSTAHESHPGYRQLDQEYIAAGMELIILREQRAGREPHHDVVDWCRRYDRGAAVRLGLLPDEDGFA